VAEPGGARLSEVGVIQLVREVQAASRQFCQRQINWFNDDPHFVWVDATRGEEEVVEEIVRAWGEPTHAGECVVCCVWGCARAALAVRRKPGESWDMGYRRPTLNPATHAPTHPLTRPPAHPPARPPFPLLRSPGNKGEHGRLTKEAAREMRTYQPVLTQYVAGGEAVRATLEEARGLVEELRELMMV
jgi:hypothetical protein